MSEKSLERQRNYEHNKYHGDLQFHLLKRYQSRANNYFGKEKHKAVDLLGCNPEFFLKYVKFCLRDTSLARHPLKDIHLHHVIPVTHFKEGDLSGWSWMNVLPVTEEENLKQKNDRIPAKEQMHLRRIIRFLRQTPLKYFTPEGGQRQGGDIQAFLSKLPFSTTGIPGELHYPKASFMGPGTSLDGADGRPARLNEDNTPKDWSKPINQVDAACYRHDLDYRDAGDNLALKHEADRKLLRALDSISTSSFGETVMKKVAEWAMKLKLKMGLGIEQMSTDELLGLGINIDSSIFTDDDEDEEQSALFRGEGITEKLSPESAKLVAEELHKPIRKHYPKRRIYFNYLDEVHSMDLMEMPNEKGYKYCLILIDNWSKFLWVIALKTKTGAQVKEALESLFESTKRIPKKIHSDHGKEFYNSTVKSFLDEKGVKLYSTQNLEKSAIAERTIGCIRNRLEPLLTEQELKGEKKSWMSALPSVVLWWNNEHVSRVTGLTPFNASLPENQEQVKLRYKEVRATRKYDNTSLDVGTIVRIYKWKDKFDKGSKQNWTSELFRVKEVLKTNPTTYKIEDLKGEVIEGSFYRSELLPSKISNSSEISTHA